MKRPENSKYIPIEPEYPEKAIFQRIWNCLYAWLPNNKIKHIRRMRRIAKIRNDISKFLMSPPRRSNEKKIDYSVYERFCRKSDLTSQSAPIVNTSSATYVDQTYINKLVSNIAQGDSSFKRRKRGIPSIIGLWTDDSEWPIDARRIETEKEYFETKFHSVQTYIDDEWDEDEKVCVLHYLSTKKQKLKGEIIVGIYTDYESRRPLLSQNYAKNYESYKLCTDGTYTWHESLEDYVALYNVRPPKFFVDHITSQIKESSGIAPN